MLELLLSATMAKTPGPRFLRLVTEAKQHVKEIAPQDVAAAVQAGAILIDIREKEEVLRGRAPGSLAIPRGILEGEIELHVRENHTPIICLCAGGNRSALAAESLQRMGYSNVQSVAGGVRGWLEAGLSLLARHQVIED